MVAGVHTPSVTHVIRAAGAIDTRWSNQEALDRGTAVHAATAMLDNGLTIKDGTLDPTVAPYVRGWLKFKLASRVKILAVEKSVTHKVHGYIGTLDRLVILNKKRGVIDLKTGVPAPWHAIQLAAYAAAVNSRIPLKRFSVYLNKKGGFRLVEHTEKTDWAVYLSFLHVHNWLFSKGLAHE